MRRFGLAILVVMAVGAAVATATPITYTFQATGTGTLGTAPFTDVPFVITVSADTLGIYGSAPLFSNPAITSTISISGFGLATFTRTETVFCAQSPGGVGITDPVANDLLDMYGASFITYGLDRSIGPIFYATPFPASQFSNVPTDLGAVTFSSYRDATFTATLGGAAIPVLHPLGVAAMALLLLAAGVLAVRRLG